ncbi:hypothetical protein Ahy_A10g046816 isoform D [Arachis hypogaea]|uniref:Uncharacterized protein n=1 Tax=Arachis hypogaea TaxID=3818 RepID=A0A445B0L4_ARAHY|nr:hypothetical protein Ahy_A10g046816 isoform D [Arachis hypogaea]
MVLWHLPLLMAMPKGAETQHGNRRFGMNWRYLNHVTNINDISIRSRPNPNPFAIGFSLHFKATNIILSKNG